MSSGFRMGCLLLWLLGSLVAQAQSPSGSKKTSTGSVTGTSTSQSGEAGAPLFDPPNTTDSTKEGPQGIVFNRANDSDSAIALLVHRFFFRPLAVKIDEVAQPLLDPTGIEHHDYADRGSTCFLSKGLGMAHISATPIDEGGLSCLFQPETHEAYVPFPSAIALYQTQRPYTSLGYASSLHEDYQVHLTHTQNIRPRWNVALGADLIKREGVYTRSAVSNKQFEVSSNYFSDDARYQLQTGVSHSNYQQQENGGIVADSLLWVQRSRSGIPVNLYQAANQWRTWNAFVHQTWNTVRPFATVVPVVANDSITRNDTLWPETPRIWNSGVWGWDLELTWRKRNYYDNAPDSGTVAGYYPMFFYNGSVTHDSVRTRELSGRLYWTNDAYPDHRWHNPWIWTVGLKPSIVSLPDWDAVGFNDWSDETLRNPYRSQASVEGFLATRLSVGSMSLLMHAEQVWGSYRNGNRNLSASALYAVGDHHTLSLEGYARRQSPDFIFYQYASNNYRWTHNDLQPTDTRRMGLHYRYGTADANAPSSPYIDLSIDAANVQNFVFINELWRPQQATEQARLYRARLEGHVNLGSWHYTFFHMLQHSDNDDVLNVPTLYTKNSLFVDWLLFHKALRLQFGTDINYHTAYYADIWNPVLGMFCDQNEVKVGGYVRLDLFASIQVKRASIYIKASHLNALWDPQPSYFALPHVPDEDFGLYWGITWKFFN